VRLLCWLLCFRQLRRKLGLSRLTAAITSRPLSPQVRTWFGAIGVDVGGGDGPTRAIGAGLPPVITSLYSSPVPGAA
jgi:hypothetical protein